MRCYYYVRFFRAINCQPVNFCRRSKKIVHSASFIKKLSSTYHICECLSSQWMAFRKFLWTKWNIVGRNTFHDSNEKRMWQNFQTNTLRKSIPFEMEFFAIFKQTNYTTLNDEWVLEYKAWKFRTQNPLFSEKNIEMNIHLSNVMHSWSYPLLSWPISNICRYVFTAALPFMPCCRFTLNY